MNAEDLFQRLKPFFDFRNSLIHRYWTVDDVRLIANIQAGRHDFDHFIEAIETYMARNAQNYQFNETQIPN